MRNATPVAKGHPSSPSRDALNALPRVIAPQNARKLSGNPTRKSATKNKQSANAISSGASTSESTRLSPPKGLDQPISMPFTRLDNGTWLHDRPEIDVYKLLIDAYRLRVEDTYVMEGEFMEGSLYAGNAHGLPGFRKFLKTAATVSGLLPPWWNDEKKEACERLGMVKSQWSDLRYAIEKHDVIEHYGDRLFPMQLRMLAEAVYKRGPGGCDGTAMRKMMVSMEAGESGNIVFFTF